MMNRVVTLLLPLAIFAMLAGCNASEDSKKADQKEQQTQAEDSSLTEKSSISASDARLVEQAAFTSLEGDTVRMADFKGKVVMIDLWETWCKPCLASFPTLQKLQEDYPEDFVVLAVTPGFTDTRKDAKAFAEEHDYNFNYLMDSNKLHQKLGVQGIPYKLFVDAEGNFIKKSMGSYGPEQDYKKISQIIEEHRM